MQSFTCMSSNGSDNVLREGVLTILGSADDRRYRRKKGAMFLVDEVVANGLAGQSAYQGHRAPPNV